MGGEIVGKLCGRELTAGDLEIIRVVVREADPPLRSEIARRVCEALQWYDVQGRAKLMSCRVVSFRQACVARDIRRSRMYDRRIVGSEE